MANSYVINVGKGFEPDPDESVYGSIFKEYERTIVESIITSFGLDAFITDRHGGDVDTIHNVRKICSAEDLKKIEKAVKKGENEQDVLKRLNKDTQMEYKNKANESAYENRGEYNKAIAKIYHSDKKYKEKNNEISELKKSGKLIDAYTGERIAPNGKTDLDHVVSAKEIHDDRGRVLSGISGTELANSDDNLRATNPHTNRTKKADSMDDFLKRKGKEYTDEQIENMKSIDKEARESLTKKLERSKSYYTSTQFRLDTLSAANSCGRAMALRQAVGFVFVTIWFEIKDEFEKAELEWNLNLDLGDFFRALGNGAKRGIEKAASLETIKKVIDGYEAGFFASLTTTICNIFFTTAKNVVRLIRQSYASIVQAAKILFINPDGYLMGDRMLAVAKIIATGASVVAGSLLQELLNSSPLGKIPVIGDVVSTFAGAFLTGILSCSLLLFLDRSKTAQNLVGFLNSIDNGVDRTLAYARQQAEFFEEYAAKLEAIDIEAFHKEVSAFSDITDELISCDSDESLNRILRKTYEKLNWAWPWGDDFDKFDEFMGNPNNTLKFGY